MDEDRLRDRSATGAEVRLCPAGSVASTVRNVAWSAVTSGWPTTCNRIRAAPIVGALMAVLAPDPHPPAISAAAIAVGSPETSRRCLIAFLAPVACTCLTSSKVNVIEVPARPPPRRRKLGATTPAAAGLGV
jgi:hypothetical protein